MQWNSCGITHCVLCSTQRIHFDLWYCMGYVLALLFIQKCCILPFSGNGYFCGPKTSCYDMAVTRKCQSCSSSPTLNHIRLVLQQDCPFYCPIDKQILSSLSPVHSSGPAVAARNCCLEKQQQLCLSRVCQVFSFHQASPELDSHPQVQRCCLSHRLEQNCPRKSMRKGCEGFPGRPGIMSGV